MQADKRIRTVLYGDQKLTASEFDVIHTPSMQRLYGLRQLGLTGRVFIDASHARISGVRFRPVAMRAASRVVSSTSQKCSSAVRSTTRAFFAFSAGRTFVCHCSRITARLPPKVSIVSWI